MSERINILGWEFTISFVIKVLILIPGSFLGTFGLYALRFTSYNTRLVSWSILIQRLIIHVCMLAHVSISSKLIYVTVTLSFHEQASD